MKKDQKILIVGAGPSGLSMAIFLYELGFKPRIIDKKTHISEYSKALGVNPRTLQLLEPFGITERFLTNGRKMSAVNLWKADKHIYRIDFARAKHKYPFMLIQPQKESEEILLDEVQKRNINIEYETDFISFKRNDRKYTAVFNNKTEPAPFDYIIGADGGHSRVREQINVKYQGFRYNEEWELYDIELETELHKDEGHIQVFPEGGMILIRLKDSNWRVAGNTKSILSYLPKSTKTGKISWESKFRIHHRVARSLTIDNVVLIGDAAHLHSPVGARGMNLGIEDAYLTSHLIDQNKLNEYDKLRRPYLEKTVNRINNITIGLTGYSAVSRTIRNQIGNFRVFFPFLMPRVRDFIMGLN